MEIIKEIISKLAPNQTKEEMLVTLFEKIRDIPYGSIGSRDPLDVFEANKGTCSGKHELLKAIYKEIGFETKDYIAIHAFNDLPINFPDDVKKHFEVGELLDPHNFFKVNFKGRWVTVDITWEKELAKFGFPVNFGWKGDNDCKICVVTKKVTETDRPIEYKKEYLSRLPTEIQTTRKDFLKDLTTWLDSTRV